MVAVIVSILVAAMLSLTFVTGWAPVLHWTCNEGREVGSGVAYVPAILVNSPFEGNASAVGVIPPYFPGSLGYPALWSFQDTAAANGTSTGTFNSVNVTVFEAQTVLAWVPGSNSRCTQPFLATPFPPPYLITYAGWPVAAVSNLSSAGEAHSVPFTPYGGYTLLTVLFNNSFTQANEPSVSTCNGNAKVVSLPHLSHSLSVGLQFAWNGSNQTVEMGLPFIGSYNYTFPANAGTWQVDNLSAPGGPGGGWAFSYLGAC